MEISQIFQEAVSKASFWKNNKERKIKSRKKEGEFFVFLVYFQKQGKFFAFFKNPP